MVSSGRPAELVDEGDASPEAFDQVVGEYPAV